MSGLTAVNRPVSRRELAIVFGLTEVELETLCDRHRIRPACRIDGMPVYGGREIRAVAAALAASREAAGRPGADQPRPAVS